ncbi:velvet factor-domain-containing protein [Collybia nuda]|uniref:Velvet factor-domain-containing protein n=1 Tax=Collybia nuda TaxID=64659 RepID=A0A9P6CI50_9AGAR|nr:velvet factor-domain-containing protein [Collybia nuda]
MANNYTCRHSRDPKSFLLFNSIKAPKRCHHVSSSNQNTLFSHRHIKTHHQHRGRPKQFATFLSDIEFSLASSGHSSPNSSITSPIFSPNGSSSSRSPASSQSSFTEGSPYSSHLIRRQPRIQVASLLADPFTRTYHLEVIQHPQKTAEFGQASLSRLPLTPPIIARLTVRDPSGNSVVPEAELPFLIAHLSLFSGDGLTALDMGSAIGRGQSPPILYGNLVSSVDQLEDLQGNTGLFFVFPDVSIRWRGSFQLGITVMRISRQVMWKVYNYLPHTLLRSEPSGAMGVSDHGTLLAEARTRSFEVLPQNLYTAVPPTRLTQCFLRQGARMFTFMSQGV